MQDEREEIIVSVPPEFVKANQNVYDLAKDADLIIEVTDARIPASGTNLLNYEDPELKDKQRMIILTHCLQADESKTVEWTSYFESKGIICLLMALTLEEANDQQNLSFWEKCDAYLKNFEDKKIIVIGMPKSGKTAFVDRLFFGATEGTKKGGTGLFGRQRVSKYNNNIEIIDTPAITGVNFTNLKVYWHTQMLGIFDIKDNVEIVAIKAFKLLLKKYKDKLEEKYSLKLTVNMTVDDIISQFLKIMAVKGMLNPDEEVPDLTLACETFLDDIKNDKITNITLEWFEDYNL
ncbi:hypothetical protein P344_05945 [Spiroplasma mirum ATCC 29335]|uniref:G domain-containing protein n=1 Tax=Spiroplasma mirum ATCC 29335 TaxID=838561 RepID=W0GS37_9MOLU|nr:MULTISPECIES: hypothetical protein [Spiroplasma]AHF61371.1 hypothetical protein SMM_0995 [Spiroplasma mirum ATCC 29335]AHI58496.1 hypothetical protein P344_05945 [Spiroplasma mirum ATCC 29335]AKM53421.1 ribosome biogenesis GTPase A [Spiroplasma atrichopogonis]